MTDDPAALVTIGEAADLTGRHRTTIRRALDRGDFPGARQDPGPVGAWRIPLDELTDAYRVATPTHADPPAAAPSAPNAQGSALALLSELAPLLQRVQDAERERADAQADARIAEHERDRLAERLDEATAAPASGVRPEIVAGLAAVAIGLAVTILTTDPAPTGAVVGVAVAALVVCAAALVGVVVARR